MDYSTLTYDELKTQKEMIEQLMQERRAAAMEEFRQKAQSMGLDIMPIFGAMNGKAKYSDGEHSWSGKGKKPRWLVEKLEAGHHLEDFTV